MRRQLWLCILTLVLVLLAVAPGAGAAGPDKTDPTIISLPDGFRPEGIVTGRGPVIYAGSLANGAIYAADLRTGEGEILAPGQDGRVAVGLSFDKRTNYIFVAGGATGKAYVHDASNGQTVGEFTLTTATPTFVNDVIVTRDAAYFTDSNQPMVYKLPLGEDGRLPAPDAVATLPLSGDYQFVAGQFNANGIEATANGKSLIIVNSTVGSLYEVDPQTGKASTIDLGGASVSAGDGLLLRGHTLYVVRNQLNQIAVIELAPDLSSGEVVGTITDPNFDVPTTLASFGAWLYAVNARFTTTPTPTTPYTIVRVPAKP